MSEFQDTFITDKKVTKLLESHRQSMEDSYKGVKSDDDEPMPMLLVHNASKDGSTKDIETTMIAMADIPEDKFNAFRTVGAKVRNDMPDMGLPVCITYSSEAWQCKFKNDKEMKTLMDKYGGRVSKMPKKNRQEIAMVFCLTAERRTAMVSYEVKRNKKGERTGLKMLMYKPKLDEKSESHMLDGFYVGWATGKGGKGIEVEATKVK